MEALTKLFHQFENLPLIISTVGYLGLYAIVFAESGLFFGFFLPGDSLLFTAGFLASQGLFDITQLLLLLTSAAIIGDSVGYAFGHRVGRGLFQKKDSLLFKKEHLLKAESFYEKHGVKTIVLARFIPVVRTFAPIVAGIAKMEFSTFLMWNMLGGTLWVFLLTLLGFFLGSLIPDVDKYLLPIVAAIVVISVVPTILHLIQDKKAAQKA